MNFGVEDFAVDALTDSRLANHAELFTTEAASTFVDELTAANDKAVMPLRSIEQLKAEV